MSKRINYFAEKSNPTEQEFGRLFQHYKLLSLNRYRWENLPDGIESRHIEEFLFNNGQAFFTYDKTMGFICLGCYNAGAVNVYGDPIKVNMIGVGYSQIKDINDGVRILNNDVAFPDVLNVIDATEKMAECEIVSHSNVLQQKFPYIVSTTKETEFSLKNLFNNFFYKKDPVIYVDKNFTENGNIGINVLRTDAPFIADKVEDYKNAIERELLTLLGLNNTENKKERMIVDEANVNNSEIEHNLDLGFKSREYAAKLINEKYNLDIKVVKVSQILEPLFDTTLCNKRHEGDDLYGEI